MSTRASSPTADVTAGIADPYDVAIVGFGFSGLATLAHLVHRARRLTVAVIASDPSGHGLAYGTRDTAHLLNVPADRMGAWAHDERDFAAWLRSDDARQACATRRVARPEPGDYAPRALFADYLSRLRDTTLEAARDRRIDVRWFPQRAEDIERRRQEWVIRVAGTDRARACVLATGNDPRRVFGAPRHPALHDGPWALRVDDVANRPGGVALIGSGLTAVDSALTVRRLGFKGDVVMLSRNGLLPRAHCDALRPLVLDPDAPAPIRTLAELERFLAEQHDAGNDWRAIVDAMRPHTAELWQRLSTEDQRTALRRWSTLWNVHRHRMAPEVASRIRAEMEADRLRVIATRRITPRVTDGRLELEFEPSEGTRQRIRPAAVIDCTGPQLNCAESEQLRGLIERRICAPHPTGLGLAADAQHRVADDLYAIGSLLTGQLWETVAVPELRDQAAIIAAQLTAERSPVHRTDECSRAPTG